MPGQNNARKWGLTIELKSFPWFSKQPFELIDLKKKIVQILDIIFLKFNYFQKKLRMKI